jgi:hypothetical protein
VAQFPRQRFSPDIFSGGALPRRLRIRRVSGIWFRVYVKKREGLGIDVPNGGLGLAFPLNGGKFAA